MRKIRDSVAVGSADKEFLKMKAREKEGVDLMQSSMINPRRVTYLRNRNASELDPFSTSSMQNFNQQQQDAILEDIVCPNYDAEL